MTPSETRAVLMDLIEKAKESQHQGPWYVDYDSRRDGADQILYQREDGRYMTLCFMATGTVDSYPLVKFMAACSPAALLPLLALALKGLELTEEIETCPDPMCECSCHSIMRASR